MTFILSFNPKWHRKIETIWSAAAAGWNGVKRCRQLAFLLPSSEAVEDAFVLCTSSDEMKIHRSSRNYELLLKRMNEARGGRENKGMFGGRLGLIHWYKRIFNFLCFSRVLPGVQVGQKGRSVRDREQDGSERYRMRGVLQIEKVPVTRRWWQNPPQADARGKKQTKKHTLRDPRQPNWHCGEEKPK